MLRRLNKPREKHRCQLAEEDDSDMGLPKCDPSAGHCRRLLRDFRKMFLISSDHPQTHFYFRSRLSIIAERRRQCRLCPWFIIHPLSLFAFYRCIFMTVVWLGCGCLGPYYLAFGSTSLPKWCMYETVLMLDVAVNFLHGYVDPRTQEMIIDVRSIGKRYARGFLLPDLLSMVPLPVCLTAFKTWRAKNIFKAVDSCGMTFLMQCLFRTFRICLSMEHVRHAIEHLGFGKFFTTNFRIMLQTVFLVHFFTCIVFFIARNMYYVNKNYNTFLKHSNLLYEINWSGRYVVCLLHTCCLFFRSCSGIATLKTIEERVLHATIMIVGHFYFAYAVVQVYDAVNVYTAVSNKFEDVERQLVEYMAQRRLPKHLRTRISIYYHHRFEKKYFRESFILDTMTEHLRYEIVMFMCMPMVKKAQFFKGLPRHLIGQLMASLNREVFLHNDVVFKYGETATKIYFIYSGSVALYSMEGMEYYHYEDGDNFGEGPSVYGGLRKYSATSTEITEMYTLTYHALRRYLRPYPQYWSKMRNNVQKRGARASAELERVKRGGDVSAVEIRDTLEYL